MPSERWCGSPSPATAAGRRPAHGGARRGHRRAARVRSQQRIEVLATTRLGNELDVDTWPGIERILVSRQFSRKLHYPRLIITTRS